MYPAVFSRTYPSPRIAEVLSAIRADGFLGAQVNLSSFGMDSLPDRLDEAALAEGRAEAARLGLTLAALSGTWNMAHPDAAYRAAMRPRFLNVLTAAKAIGAPVVTLCTGSRDAADMWADHPGNATPGAWADMCAEIGWALDRAAGQGLTLAIEPEPANVVRDAPAARRLLDEVRAPHLKIVLDAANLIGVEGLGRQPRIIAGAMELLGQDIALAHAKDIDRSGRVAAPGDGAIDLPGFATALRAAGFDGALIGHGFPAADTSRAGRSLAALCTPPP